MKASTLIFLSVILIFFGSCSSYSYFYSRLDTSDYNVNKDKNGTFVVQQDSLNIYYRFVGRNVPITIGVENKSSVPAYISWKKSGIVLENAQTKSKKRVIINAARKENGAIDFGRFQSDPEALMLVKPHSKVEKQIVELSNFNYHKIDKKLFSSKYVDVKKNGEANTYKSIDYRQNHSPIQFKIYLSIYPQNNTALEPIFLETYFYQSQLIKGGKDDPYQMSEYLDGHGDFFYVKKENARTAKQIGKGSLGVVSLLGTAALWVVNEKLNEEETWR